jgi:hypothetical protein
MDHYDKILSLLEKPYLKNLISIGVTEEHYEPILKKIYDQSVSFYLDGFKIINNDDDNGNLIYYENSSGEWYMKEYYSNGKEIYYENSYGYWVKRGYDENNRMIYKEDTNGISLDNRNK